MDRVFCLLEERCLMNRQMMLLAGAFVAAAGLTFGSADVYAQQYWNSGGYGCGQQSGNCGYRQAGWGGCGGCRGYRQGWGGGCGGYRQNSWGGNCGYRQAGWGGCGGYRQAGYCGSQPYANSGYRSGCGQAVAYAPMTNTCCSAQATCSNMQPMSGTLQPSYDGTVPATDAIPQVPAASVPAPMPGV